MNSEIANKEDKMAGNVALGRSQKKDAFRMRAETRQCVAVFGLRGGVHPGHPDLEPLCTCTETHHEY